MASWAKRLPSGHDATFRVNWPRSAFLNRASFPLTLISFAMAAYSVAQGVLPPGDCQYPLVAIDSISSLQFIGLPASPRTLAAASMALSLRPGPSRLGLAGPLAAGRCLRFIGLRFACRHRRQDIEFVGMGVGEHGCLVAGGTGVDAGEMIRQTSTALSSVR